MSQLPYGGTPCRSRGEPVVLVGFYEQGNLGLGYLAAVLEQHGYQVTVLDIEQPRSTIVDVMERVRPVLVGFSLIFQFYINQFAEVAREARARGVTAHFTMGGHFPSLSSEATLRLVPELDSVVRFEGELTLLELVDCLSAGRDWHEVDGLSYMDMVGERIVNCPDRPLIADLDELPGPHRWVKTRSTLGRQSAQLIASRGCARTCSFCSIHMFYRNAPGKVVRIRRPAEVAREMRELRDAGATILLFQDDDFPIFGPAWHRWARELLAEIRREGLVGELLWKINCRADAVDPVLLREMREAGLYCIYMGLESGSESGLRALNKRITVAQNIRAVDTLKALEIVFDFGFMMLDPSSTFDSIAENVAFLRRIVGDGSAPAEFSRMVPYDGTPIKEQLVHEGRLRGDVINPDYDFVDARIETFFRRMYETLATTGWLYGLDGVCAQLKYAWQELAIMERLNPDLVGLDRYSVTLRRTTRQGNETLLRAVEQLVAECRDGGRSTVSTAELRQASTALSARMIKDRDEFVGRHERELLDAAVPRELVAAD